MAIGYRWELPGVSLAQYQQLLDELDVVHEPVAGLLSLDAGTDDRGLRVTTIFENDQAFQRFVIGRLSDVLAVVQMPQPKITRFDVPETV